jgi:hypothetical protein
VSTLPQRIFGLPEAVSGKRSFKMDFIWGGLAILVAIISYIGFHRPKSGLSSRKARQAKAMKEAFKSMSGQTSPVSTVNGIKVGFFERVVEEKHH